jgi:DNA-binding GntR family transcriptional regulator
MSGIDTSSLVDRVYEHLLTRIIAGDIRYGAVLNIRQVAAELGTSPMPVREALKRLEFERVVSIKPRSFCSVRRPSRRMIREVYELRELFELHALACYARQPEPARLRPLRAIVKDMRTVSRMAHGASRERRTNELDRAFHTELCGLAGNEYLDTLHRQLSVHVNMTLIHEKTFSDMADRYVDSHEVIVRSLETEPRRTAAVLKKHFADVRRRLLRNTADEPQAARGP